MAAYGLAAAVSVEDRILRIGFVRPPSAMVGRNSVGRERRVGWQAEIHNVERYELEETEHVGRYDLNELRFAPAMNAVTITTGMPLKFSVTVNQLDVRLRESIGEAHE